MRVGFGALSNQSRREAIRGMSGCYELSQTNKDPAARDQWQAFEPGKKFAR
jgi:hypothetical protein